MPNLMHNSLTFGNLEEYRIFLGGGYDGIRIERIPNQNRPERKADVYDVPGRNGSIVFMQDAWENVDQSYEIWGSGGTTEFGYFVSRLFAMKGYHELRDTYDPDHYRLAYFTGPFDVESNMMRRGRATITFSCDPRRFFEEYRNIWIDVTVSGRNLGISTPTPYDAKPLIRVSGSGSGSVTIGGKTLYINNITDQMVLDCENEEASYQGTFLNADVYGDFPIIPGYFGPPGQVESYPPIYFDGGVTKVLIRTNWWEL